MTDGQGRSERTSRRGGSERAGHWWHDARAIGALAWPVLIGQLAIIAFGVIDTAMVGRYASLDLAALGLGASIYISVYVGLTGILGALSPIAAQLHGARRPGEIGEEVRQAGWLAAALAVIGMVLLAFPGPLLALSDASPALAERTVAYLRVLSFGLPAALLFRIYNSLSTALGRPRLVMALQLIGLALKVPANLWLIFGGLGVAARGAPGAALATTAINWALALIGVGVLYRHAFYRPFGIFLHASRPNPARLWALLRLGVPMGLSYLIEVTAYTFMAIFIARFGTTPLAGHQIAANLGAVLYMTPMSLGIATATLVAQALGARERERARRLSRHGITIAALLAVLYAVALLAARGPILSAYSADPAVVAAAGSLLGIVALYHFFDAVQISTAFALRAHKVAVVPTLIYAFALWGVGLGGGYVLGFDLTGWVPARWQGARGFWLANALSLGVAALGLLAYRRVVVGRPRD
ncbi:MATE family efflux transporter [Chitinasiproducens palmae]|uniref:Multidrug-efflux transporter n=1 Tax=Chitinasiproducens palmae TaxID=1770053 RepID=A0A1H2PM11_9BURK|nr:MATE family efflux transporter [Chitinasiproducens palmae]SDV47568.1 multidrug resistance protein, MATE family [Chitinasiproducens palmae]